MNCLTKIKYSNYLFKNINNNKILVCLNKKFIKDVGGIYIYEVNHNLINNILNRGTIVAEIQTYNNLFPMNIEMPFDGRLINYNYNFPLSNIEKQDDWIFEIQKIEYINEFQECHYSL